MSRFKAVTKFGARAFFKSKAAVAVAAGSVVALAGSASATPPEPENLIDWATVTGDIKASLSEPATQAVIIGGLVLAAILGWALIKRFAR